MTTQSPHTIAVVLAGGVGRRMGAATPKQLLPLAGRPIIAHAIEAFETAPEIDEILVIMAPGFTARAQRIVAELGCRKVTRVCTGGAERTRSTERALAAVDADDDARVLLHDAVRPLVRPRIIADCVTALRDHRAVAVAVPSSDTIVIVEDGTIIDVPDRATLYRQQTPQGFRLGTIRAAYRAALADPAFTATDDCGVVRRYLPDTPIHVVAGDEDNIKITHAADLEIAERLLRLRDGE